MANSLIFVYGTLKLGFGNNRLLKDATYVGKAETSDMFFMADGGFPVVYSIYDPRFPGLKDHLGFVVGEAYEVDDAQLSSCDALEGHPEWYHRYETPIIFREDSFPETSVIAWIYVGDNVSRPAELLMKPDATYRLEWKGH